MSIDIKLPAIDKLRAAMNFDVLVQPEIDDARDTFVNRFLRQGSGVGAKRNALSAETRPLSATVTSTLHHPRTVGSSMHRKDEQIARAMAPNVIRKMVRNIQARFAGERLMDIRGVHAALAALLVTVAVTEPVASKVKQVWKDLLPARLSIIDLPCVLMQYDLTGCSFGVNGRVEQQYDIHTQVFVGQVSADGDTKMDLASAYLDEIVTLLSAHQRLDKTVDVIRGFRGGGQNGETRTRLEHNKEGYVGLDLIIPVTLTDTRTRGA